METTNNIMRRRSEIRDYIIKTQNGDLTPKERADLFENLFPQNKERIDCAADYLATNIRKIDGFDYRWSSLLTNRPLLFEDQEYVRILQFVEKAPVPKELQAYKEGKLRKLYITFEAMLMDNLAYYDRIMNFCTLAFMRYVKITENGVDSFYTDGLDEMPLEVMMSPTQIWCCACCGPASTKWELDYAWGSGNKSFIKHETDNLIRDNFESLYRNPIFARFVEYCAARVGTKGFMNTMLADITSNLKLSNICKKFTLSSTAIDESQLESLSGYIIKDSEIAETLSKSLDKCLNNMYLGDESKYSIYVYANEFLVCTKDFKLRVKKEFNPTTKSIDIKKEYISNAYMCLVSEAKMVDTIKDQINWVRSGIDVDFEFDKQTLRSMLSLMLKEDYRDIKCVRRQLDPDTYSEITFKKVWNNYKAIEVCYSNGIVVHEYPPVVFGIKNMVEYIVDRGYYTFGTIHDMDVMFIKEKNNIQVLKQHYSNYCVPVKKYLTDVIERYRESNNEIIDVLLGEKVPIFNNPAIRVGKGKRYGSEARTDRGNQLEARDIMRQIERINKKRSKREIDKMMSSEALKIRNVWNARRRAEGEQQELRIT